MKPGADERPPGRGLALGDLVLVVGEDEVHAPGVDVERGPEVGHAHRGALDVPAGPSRADGRVPGRLAGLGALPQREVPDIVLAVLVRLDPLPHPHGVRVQARQPPVGRPRGDPEEDRPVVGPVGVPLLEQRTDELGDLRDVLRRPGQDVRARHAQGVRVGKEPLRVPVRQVGRRDPLGRGATDDLVVDVGDVHRPGNAQAAVAQIAHQEVRKQERAEVADMGGPVHGRSAAVDTDVARLDRLERAQPHPRGCPAG